MHVMSSMFHSFVCLTSLRLSTLHSAQSLSHLPLHLPDLHLHFLCGSVRREIPCALPRMRSLTLWSTTPLTSYETKFFDDYHFSETTEIFIRESSSDTRPSHLHAVTRPSTERSLHHCSFRSEKNQRAQSFEETLLPSQSLSVCHVRTERFVIDEFGSLISNIRKIHVATQKMSKSRFFWNDKESRFSLTVRQRFKNTNSKSITTEEVFKLNETFESEREEICRAHQGDEQLRRDQQLLHEQLLEQNLDLREVHDKSK